MTDTDAAGIILSSGEPAGIGPDVCLMLARDSWPARLVVAGDIDVLRQRATQLGVAVTLNPVTAADAGKTHRAGHLDVLHIPAAVSVQAGQLDPRNAPYVLRLLDACADACVHGAVQAMVTAPVHKGVINDAGIKFSGHTEYLAARTDAPLPVMMLCAKTLRVALATTHLPLRDVADALDQTTLAQVLRITHTDLQRLFGIASPAIAVCGLNPHAGEGGHLGSEDDAIIAPVIAALREQGMDMRGPLPADTAFTPRVLEHVDAVVAMYHDQGLPVLKYAGFGEAVNITLGLPILRTSVDHGTALDLAGTGKASAGSLHAATALALRLCNRA